MTTIVYDHKNKIISIDSLVNDGSTVISKEYDKTIENDLGLWFISGDISDYEELVILEHNEQVKDVNCLPECYALLVKGQAVYYVHVNKEGRCKYMRCKCNETLGSGSSFALSALDFGKTAKEAVIHASYRDIYTGGSIRVYDVTLGKFISELDDD